MTRDFEVALEAARTGAGVVRSYRKNELNLRYKGVNDLVTDADLATEKKIMEVIKEFFPGDEFLAEETADHQNIDSGRVWIIDPIDGTTNFAHGFPVYCVSVGLWIDGRPEAGVVIEVNRNEEFTALRGEGAWLNGNEIQVSDLQEPEKALLGTGFPYRDYSLIDEYIKLLRSLMDTVQGIRRPGAAAYDLCCVAAGRFQGFFEYGLNVWDVAAAALIIQEAGGVVTDWKGGEDWKFGRRVTAGNKATHRFLLEEIARHISAGNR
ncbi:MAG: inositol monophosphatase family protein [Balneolaceae bacterium]